MSNVYQYVNPETDEVVEADEHAYFTGLKQQGFVLVDPDHVRNLRPEGVEVNDAGKGQQAPLTAEQPAVTTETPVEAQETARRRQAAKDDVRG